ncbi:hypothetical protein [Leisingera sp. M523]|uniref:hypothetical protein n=1 Tax=Leisingera sp. M523 TaxID=2867013 RepID=UPI0021A3FBC7|nr:hypothetical protein [Leisingera sp. M523]UWQ29281.1 hypothetical protein K3557_01520 [Leisingera sp. M523]
MKKTRCREAQILGVLRQMEGGAPATELCREHGSEAETELIQWINSPPNRRHAVKVAGEVWRHGRQSHQ